MRNSIYSSIICLALASGIASCQYKDFNEYDGTIPVKVVVDYTNSGCASAPAISRVLFYPLEGQGSPFIFDIKDSAVVNLPTGMMQSFAYNNNSDINRTRGFQDVTASPVIYTDKADYRGIFQKDDLDKTLYYDYPDTTYTSWKTVGILGNEKISSADDNRIVLPMTRVTREVTIEVRGIRNASFLHGVRMSLSGINREYSPVEGFSHSNVSIVADGTIHTADPDKDNRSVFDGKTVIDTLRSTMNIYGVGQQGHILTAFLDGGNWHKVLSFDVTAQVQSQEQGLSPIHIIVETDYDTKDDVPVSGGFDVNFSDWDDKEVPVDMH